MVVGVGSGRDGVVGVGSHRVQFLDLHILLHFNNLYVNLNQITPELSWSYPVNEMFKFNSPNI